MLKDCNKETIEQTGQLIKQLQLPPDFIRIVDEIYIPLARAVINKKSVEPLFVSINGAQGTGKSTLTRFLKLIIESEFACHVAEFSLDDFYLTRKQRVQVADKIHPLFGTRGVPGTHDINLIESTLSNLCDRKVTEIPRFNKATDDRCAQSEWTRLITPVDVILFEGWCNHSTIQQTDELLEPINELERTEDPDAIWRNHSNEMLKEYHQRIFNFADLCIMLQAPDFESVYGWRKLQEAKLRESTRPTEQARIMNDKELARFIQHYERITRHTLDHLPKLANLILPITSGHKMTRIQYNELK